MLKFQAWLKYSCIVILSDGMFKNLRFLVLDNFGWLQPFSIQLLDILRTLFLNHCALHYIDGFPHGRDSLYLRDCIIPQPLNLPSLPYLQKLEILGNSDEVHFLPSTIYLVYLVWKSYIYLRIQNSGLPP